MAQVTRLGLYGGPRRAYGAFSPAPGDPGFRYTVVNDAMPTSGTQEVRSVGFGTPKAVIVLISGGTSDGGIVANGRLGVGIIDDTNQHGISMVIQDAVATSNTNRHLDDYIITGASAPLEQTIGIQISGALVEDGVDLTVVDGPASAYFCTYIMFAGDDLEQVEALLWDDLGDTIGDKEVTLSKTWASAPNFMFGATWGGSAVAPEAEILGIFSTGWSDFTSHVGNIFTATDAVNGSSPSSGLVSNTDMIGQSILGGSPQWVGYPHTPTTTNFQFNTRQASGTDIALFLIMKLADSVKTNLQTITVPTSGDLEINTGITPGLSFISLNEGVTALNANETAYDASVAYHVYDGTTISTISASSIDSVSKSVYVDSLATVNTAGTAASIVGTPSFDGTNVKWSLTGNPGTEVLGYSVTFGTSGAGSAFIRDLVQDTIQDTISDLVQ